MCYVDWVISPRDVSGNQWIDSAACAASVLGDGITTTVLIITLKQSRTGFKQ